MNMDKKNKKRLLCFATGNKDKFKEAKEILSDFDLRQISIDLPELQGSPEEVAEKKAKLAFKETKKPVFVDDTGLAFHALNGMPGIYIKHFLHAIRQEGLVKLLLGFEDKGATAFASIGYCDGKTTKVFIGECKGKIVPKKDLGYGFGFGWDPIFQPDGFNDTFASMKPEIKNKISHRRKALEMLRDYLS